MRFPLKLWVVGAALAVAAGPLAASEIAVMEAHSVPPFDLVAPRAGQVWEGGSTAILEWRALGPLAAAFESGEIDEWEAFLSVDGGLSYPLRLTPHMEGDESRLELEVPNLPARDARLLFRFGDGRHDFAWRLPLRFAIAASPLPPRAGRPAVRREPERGERALAGEPGVTAWVERSADGQALEWVYADLDELSPRDAPPELSPAGQSGFAALPQAFPSLTEPRLEPRPQPPPEKLAAAVPRAESFPPLDILAKTKRLNE